jgi:Ca2+-binding RTX toxin-like protein
MSTVALTATYIGVVGSTGIYRVDLTQSGLTAIQAITIFDDRAVSGGTGAASGFDLDFLKISSTLTDSPSAASGLQGDAVFDFSGAGVVFQPGFMQAWDPSDPVSWSAPNLLGTVGANSYSPSLATLDVQDAASISLGEGGWLTAFLNQPLAIAGPKYLYFGDDGGANDGVEVQVSGVRAAPPVTGLRLTGTDGPDNIVLGRGINLHLGAGNDTIDGARGNDRILSAGGDDILFGSSGNDSLYGEAGADRLYGGTGRDKLSGGLGNDRLYGNAGNDTVIGGPGDDWLYGNSGNDRVIGGRGNDKLYGGAGKDQLTGDAGKDDFVFNTKPHSTRNFDKITDYKVKDDSVWLENAVFKGLGRGGTVDKPVKLQAKYFWKGSEAHDANDRIIYNPDNGALYYDRDGTGSAAQVKFAEIKKNLAMTHKEFFLI